MNDTTRFGLLRELRTIEDPRKDDEDRGDRRLGQPPPVNEPTTIGTGRLQIDTFQLDRQQN